MREDAMPTLSLLLSLKHLEQAHSVEEGLNERLQRIEERLSQSGGLADEGLARSAILAYMSAVESSTVQLQSRRTALAKADACFQGGYKGNASAGRGPCPSPGEAAGAPEGDRGEEAACMDVDVDGQDDREAGMPAATSIDRPQETASDGQVVILQKGNPVAALCRVEEGTLQRDWILATIVAYDPHTDSYEVEDVELSETGEIVMGSAPPAAGRRSTSGTPPPPPHGARRSTVAARRGASRFLAQRQGVRALSPTYEEALVATASVRIKERVLALFPGTTCLYPATVVNVPSRRRKTGEFVVIFKDDHEAPYRTVSPRYILPLGPADGASPLDF